jgi:hypothetical protein
MSLPTDSRRCSSRAPLRKPHTKQTAVLLLCALLAAPAAHAADDDDQPSLTGPTMAFALGAAADWASTAAFLRVGGQEGNPVIAWAQARPTAMIGLGAAIDVGELLTVRYVAARWHHQKLAVVTLYGMAVLRGGIAYRNIRIMDATAAMQASERYHVLRR